MDGFSCRPRRPTRKPAVRSHRAGAGTGPVRRRGGAARTAPRPPRSRSRPAAWKTCRSTPVAHAAIISSSVISTRLHAAAPEARVDGRSDGRPPGVARLGDRSREPGRRREDDELDVGPRGATPAVGRGLHRDDVAARARVDDGGRPSHSVLTGAREQVAVETVRAPGARVGVGRYRAATLDAGDERRRRAAVLHARRFLAHRFERMSHRRERRVRGHLHLVLREQRAGVRAEQLRSARRSGASPSAIGRRVVGEEVAAQLERGPCRIPCDPAGQRIGLPARERDRPPWTAPGGAAISWTTRLFRSVHRGGCRSASSPASNATAEDAFHRPPCVRNDRIPAGKGGRLSSRRRPRAFRPSRTTPRPYGPRSRRTTARHLRLLRLPEHAQDVSTDMRSRRCAACPAHAAEAGVRVRDRVRRVRASGSALRGEPVHVRPVAAADQEAVVGDGALLLPVVPQAP